MKPSLSRTLRWNISLQCGLILGGMLCSEFLIGAATASADDLPLHQRIDQWLAEATTAPVAATCTDAEFLRRVMQDLVGTIPTSAELREFLADAEPDKRQRCVDRLLNDPRHSLHLAEVFDAWLMERRPARHVPHPEWLGYLQASFRVNKPWNQLVQELVTSDGTQPAQRPAARFFLDREAEPHVMTRDIGRIFFGMDLQCAQCHDHPLVDHYAQSDYYGLYAFVNRTVIFNDEAAKQMQLGEKAEGHADYQSVFTQDASRSRPCLPGDLELEEPHFPLGQEYLVAPADKVRPVSKHSRRSQLALATDGRNAAFNRNLPNRLWAYLFGRGLVHPVDWHHPHNPPTHPAVLDGLTAEFVAKGFDIRHLLRGIVLSAAYQRSLNYPIPTAAQFNAAPQALAAITQQLAALEKTAAEAFQKQSGLYEEMKAAHEALKPIDQAHQKSIQAALALKKPLADAELALTKAQAQVTGQQNTLKALTELHTKATETEQVVKNDAELQQATALIAKRRTAAEMELATFQAAVEQKQQAVTAAREKWTTAVAASEAEFEKLQTAAQPWEQSKQAWAAARRVTLSAVADFEFQKLQQQHWQQMVDLASAQQAVRLTEDTLAQSLPQLPVAKQLAEDLSAKQKSAQQNMVTVKAATDATSQQLQSAQSQLATQNEIRKSLQEAVAATDAALEKIPGDLEVLLARTKIQERFESFQPAVSAAETQVASATTGHQSQLKALEAAEATAQAAQQAWTAQQQTVATLTSHIATLQNELPTNQSKLDEQFQRAHQLWEHEFSTRTEKPLSPEQLAMSMMTATGSMDSQRGIADRELEKTLTLASVQQDPAKLADRQYQVEQLLRQRLRGNVNAFIALYAAGAGQPQDQFFATADQALFVGNGGTVRAWLTPTGSPLLLRLQKLDNPSEFADELYLSTLCRLPSAEELAELTRFLSDRIADRPVALQELLWAMVSCAEFRFGL